MDSEVDNVFRNRENSFLKKNTFIVRFFDSGQPMKTEHLEPCDFRYEAIRINQQWEQVRISRLRSINEDIAVEEFHVGVARAERTLRLELDDDAWDRLYGHRSHPIPATPGRKVAVRVVSQFGEESMKVLAII